MTQTNATQEAMVLALDDEFKARALYRAVIAKFGLVLPFANIVESESCHIAALQRLFAARGWEAPCDAWTGNIAAPASLEEACKAGVDAEIENVELYDRLFKMTDDDEVLGVFEALRRASQQCHLPAFQRGMDKDGSCQIGGRHHGHHGHGHGHRCKCSA